jgi:hypothetical protein
VYTGIEYLRYIEGEKHLIFVTEQGLFLPRADDDRLIAALANDARVTIDTIQTGGMFGERPGSRWLSEAAWRQTFSIAGLKTVAELTGGQSSVFKFADRAIDRIDRATRFSYLLGYYPSNPTWDGRYRRITLKVNRPGVTVLFRHGYYASQQLVPFDRREFLTHSRVRLATNYADDIRDIKLGVKASLVKGAGGGQEVLFEVTIDASRLAFARTGDEYAVALDIALMAGETRLKMSGDLEPTLSFKLNEAAYQRARAEGLLYTRHVPVTGRVRWVKVIVYDYEADRVGTMVAPVK